MFKQKRSYRAFASIMVVFLALLVVACGGGSSGGGGSSSTSSGPKTLKIIAVPKSLASSYWTIVENGVKCYASKVPAVNIVWNGVQTDTQISDQISLLQNYITQSPDGLLYAATDAKALAPVTQQAVNAHIPVFNFDSGTTPQTVPLFATDNTASAAKAADEMGTLLNGTGKIAVLEFVPGSATNDQRVNGFKQELAAKYPNIQIVADQADGSDSAKALSITQNIMSAHPDVKGIYAANQQGGEGAAQALNAASLGGKVHLISFDASDPLISDLQKGTADALVVQNPFKMGYDSLKAMVNQIRNGTKAQNEDTGVTLVTKANFNDSATQSLLNPSCANAPV
ncbi:MAG TPA: substrate-binding domain-containing protein [Ktedonobacteraceae bacterium]|nr:substrate-binding domain-containing protein [Ktedonobacteraceae bacterium]